MTVTKIISIKNVGRFSNSAASGDVTFRKYNLLFAENGRGKTTLCAILRSLQSGESAHIAGRRTLGSQTSPEIRLLANGSPVVYSNGGWDNTLPAMMIFDGSFVADNVHAGEAVSTDHRRNLYRVIIGEQGVTLARRLDELDKLIREKNGEIRAAKSAVEQNLPQGMSADAFLDLPDDPMITDKIAAKDTELRAAREAEQIQQRALLARLALPAFPSGLSALLQSTVAGIAEDAAQQVASHCARHQMGDRGEAWIGEGVGYIKDDACPFCAQPVAGLDLIDAYKAFFSEAYETLKEQISAMTDAVALDFGDRKIAEIERTIELNREAATFWHTYCEFAAPALPDGEAPAAALRRVREAILATLSRKAASPLEAVACDDSVTASLSRLASMSEAYNDAVTAANDIIAQRKQQAGAADLAAINIALLRLRAQQARHTPTVDEACGRLQELNSQKKAWEDEKAETREMLDAHTAQVISKYGEGINRFLHNFNAAFRISPPTHSYRGGTPSSTYQIIINGKPVDLGDATTPLDQPSFRNTLSAGDRSTLALALFFSQVDQHPDRENLVVVLDDPFTSQDNFRRNNTAYQIKKCGEGCGQVIVLSHDQTFLKLVWDKIDPAKRKTLQLARVGEENTTIAEWDVEKACQTRYKLDVDTLQRYHQLGEGERRDVIQKIRPVIEGYCRNLYPAQFGDSEMMGGIISKIRTAGAGHPLFAVVDDFEEINEFCRRYHHGESPNAATEPIDDNELQGYAKRALTLTGCF